MSLESRAGHILLTMCSSESGGVPHIPPNTCEHYVGRLDGWQVQKPENADQIYLDSNNIFFFSASICSLNILLSLYRSRDNFLDLKLFRSRRLNARVKPPFSQ